MKLRVEIILLVLVIFTALRSMNCFSLSVCMQIKYVSPRAEALNEVKGRAQGLVLP